jgi:transposase InsO family protein
MAELVVSMEQRMAVAFAACGDGPVNVTAFCAEHAISRQTFYVYRRRFQAQGLAGLLPRSRRPARSPSKTTPAGAESVLEVHDTLLEQGWDAGARSVRDRMLQQKLSAPSDRTIHRILLAHGRVKPSPKKRRRDSYRRFEAAAPNGMWQLDGTKRALADGAVVCILRVIDDHSRLLLATRVAPSENMADTWALLQEAMDRHGRPAMLLHDGSVAFSGVRQGRNQVTDLQWHLRRLGVHQIVSSPYHPQTCGKKERDWQPLHRWLDAHPDAASITDLQRLVDAYDAVFNTERTHQGIGRVTPAQRYHATAKAEPDPTADLPPLTFHNEVTAGRHGRVSLGAGGYSITLGHAWAGATLTVLRHDLDAVIFHGPHVIRRVQINPDTKIQPSGLHPGRPRRNPLPSAMS